jgi:DNA replication and repair protein RecF
MYCHEIQLSNFRNVKHAIINFSEGVNLLVGDNAQGKTNLLEAIYFAAIGKSFRGASCDELVMFGEPKTDVILIYNDTIRSQMIAMQLTSDRRKILEQNGLRVRKMSDIIGNLRVVLFIPEHLSLVKEGPAARRNWLDVALCQLYPGYMAALTKYNKLLKNRNKLIKDYATDADSFANTADFWSEQLAREASILTAYRYDYVKKVNRHAYRFFSDMTSDKENVEFIYTPSCKLLHEDCIDIDLVYKSYLKLLTSNYDRELAAGSSLWGSHKDDIEINLNGRAAREFASQGQQRSIALAMKLAEGEISREVTGDTPVFLFDDVLSELDVKRRTYLLSELHGKQVIMTGCDRSITGDAYIINVENGIYMSDEDKRRAEERQKREKKPDDDGDVKVV